jgi:phospholipase C
MNSTAPQMPLDDSPAPEWRKAVRHVVFLMQENRSFDHYFGSDFRGVRGYRDRNLATLPDGRTVLDQPDQDSPVPVTYRPYRLDPKNEKREPLSHNWDTGHEAWNNGRYDQWIEAKGGITMGYLDQEVVGTYRDLAEKYTVCDAYHASVMGETSSNRNYFFSGFGGWEPNDGSSSAGTRVTGAEAHDREDPKVTMDRDARKAGYDWPSYPEIMEVNNDPFGPGTISWKVYQGWDNFYDNNLEFHDEFKRIFEAVLKGAGFSDISLFAFYDRLATVTRDAKKKNDPEAIELAKKLCQKDVDTLNKAAADPKVLSPAEKSLYDRGLYRCPPAPGKTENPGGYTDFVYEFFKDVHARQAPRVSYLVPAEADSEHPGSSGPTDGQKIVRQVLDVIASCPDMRDSTVLFISYDENDGFFDHVPPPVPPADVEDEYAKRGKGPVQPIGLGNRVPMIVVSPWTTGGYVNSQVFDHTSQVRFLEEWLGVRQPAISRWRRTVAGDLTSVFDFTGAGAELKQPDDPERRLARPLPYQPDAHGALGPKGDVVALSMSNAGASSAHLTLYAYGAFQNPQHFDVLGTSDKPFEVPLKDGTYDFYLTGPNGFRREFAGTAAGAAAGADLTTAIASAPKRSLTLTVTTSGSKPLNVTVKPRHYSKAQPKSGTASAGNPLVLPWDTEDAEGWYDLEVTIAEDDSFRRRLMGHIENRKPSISG